LKSVERKSPAPNWSGAFYIRTGLKLNGAAAFHHVNDKHDQSDNNQNVDKVASQQIAAHYDTDKPQHGEG